MVAASDIHFTNIQQRIDHITPGVLPSISTDRITKCLPLKTTDDILQMEVKLKNEDKTFINEYKTFVVVILHARLLEMLYHKCSQMVVLCNVHGKGVNKILKLPLYIS